MRSYQSVGWVLLSHILDITRKLEVNAYVGSGPRPSGFPNDTTCCLYTSLPPEQPGRSQLTTPCSIQTMWSTGLSCR